MAHYRLGRKNPDVNVTIRTMSSDRSLRVLGREVSVVQAVVAVCAGLLVVGVVLYSASSLRGKDPITSEISVAGNPVTSDTSLLICAQKRDVTTESITTKVVISDQACLQPQEVGVCLASIHRVFFNVTSGLCETFIYGGCGGNANNFDTFEECRALCE